LLDFWADLPWWLRLLVAGGLIVGGVWLILDNVRQANESEPFAAYFADDGFMLGVLLLGIGAALALIGGRTDAEKKGYRF
jgi:hypothetical protein